MNKFGGFLVFAGIIILCGIALYIANPLKNIADNNDKIREKDLLNISQALEKFHADYGRYPASSSKDFTIISVDQDIPWGTGWEPYITILPKDPSGSRRYVYVSTVDDNYQSYRIYASLEDPASIKNACSISGECSNAPGKDLCGGNAKCNFGVTSGNVSP